MSKVQPAKFLVLFFALSLLALSLAAPNRTNVKAAGTAVPALPRVLLNTTYVTPTGNTINVAAGGDLQSAINSAQPGDVIKLAAGATFTGNFTLPVKSGSSYIYIRTSAPDSSLPAPGTRVTPSNAASMPKIVTSNSIGAITTDPAAHHYRFVGIELAVASSVTQNYAVLSLGDASSTQERRAFRHRAQAAVAVARGVSPRRSGLERARGRSARHAHGGIRV